MTIFQQLAAVPLPTLRANAAAWLAQHGWKPAGAGEALCTKEFATSVGPRQAHARIELCHSGNFLLQGEYHAEGRNVLELTRFTIPRTPSNDELASAVEAFNSRVTLVIGNTYAVRLLHKLRCEA